MIHRGLRFFWIFAAGWLLVFPAFGAIPFVLPWNDSVASVTDFSSFNTAISNGSPRVMADTNGHFVVEGERVRFLGFNFAGDSPFAPTNKADAMAARLAKYGVNCVRFHHMDASWATGGGLLSYTTTTSTNFNASQLDKVHYMVSRLRAHGIYSDINLLVGREYRSADGLGTGITSLDWKTQHVLAFFNDTALALHKDYATKLLNPTNRYTGLPLARDPGVAFVEIINENGILQKWFDDGLDVLTEPYATQLRVAWNNWLATNYVSESAMLSAWKATNQPLGPNLLKNGAFTSGLSYWYGEQHDTAKASFTVVPAFTNGAPAACIAVTNSGTTSWYIQFNQANVSVSASKPYTIAFWAKAAAPTTMNVSVMRAHDDYAGGGYNQTVTLTTNWQRFTNTFSALFTDSNVRVNFGGIGDKLCTVYVADVWLQAGGRIGMPPNGTSVANKTIPSIGHNGGSFVATTEARKDWIRFLRDLEYRYYEAMMTHVRSNIGYNGLIFGTIMANSPATAQSKLDVIDAHAYWMHPAFPGQPWDSTNWYVPNVSMVNTVGSDNTFSGLALQRVKGKPFTVTEYQHPSPNYYGGEGPLLLAAYAGLQDWDGLWLFDYGPGNDSVPMGYARGYFDTSQHPTKMANLLLAANLFRRGDVRPAVREYTMALTADTELESLASKANAWSLFSSGQLGMPNKVAFVNRVSTSVGANAAGLTNAPGAPTGSNLASDTGELRWNASVAGKGVVTVNSGRTKAVIGFTDNANYALGDLTFRPGVTQLGWSSFGATLVKGDSFTNECTAVLIASGWWENTGQVWTSTNKTSVGNKWGGAPVLAEVIPFSLTLPVGTNRVSAWSLDATGRRKAALPITGDGQSSTLTVTTNAGTLWYELQVKPRMTGFQLWQQRYFSGTDLTNGAVSGPGASPVGDGVPNLWKYYMGLSASNWSGVIASPEIWKTNGRNYLAVSYTHDASATGVTCTAEVSSNLMAWLSGAGQTDLAQRNILGNTERVTIYDLNPMDAGDQRYLRLRLDPAPGGF